MNNKWMLLIDNKELDGWVKIPNYLHHNYKQLGLTAEEAIFLIDIISNSEDYIIYDQTYMSTHGCQKTLQRRRKSLRKKGFLAWERYDKYDSESESVKSSGFKYDTSSAIEKIMNFISQGQMCPSKEHSCLSSTPKRPPTKESITKESISKESFNNIPSNVSVVNDAPTEGVYIKNKPINEGNEIHTIQLDYNELEYINDDEDLQYVSYTKPSTDLVQAFIDEYKLARQQYKLPELKNIQSHTKNIELLNLEDLKSFIEYPLMIQRFFTYCDDISYDMNIRRYECNSDRSPSVMLQESVYRRYIDWYNKNY